MTAAVIANGLVTIAGIRAATVPGEDFATTGTALISDAFTSKEAAATTGVEIAFATTDAVTAFTGSTSTGKSSGDAASPNSSSSRAA